MQKISEGVSKTLSDLTKKHMDKFKKLGIDKDELVLIGSQKDESVKHVMKLWMHYYLMQKSGRHVDIIYYETKDYSSKTNKLKRCYKRQNVNSTLAEAKLCTYPTMINKVLKSDISIIVGLDNKHKYFYPDNSLQGIKSYELKTFEFGKKSFQYLESKNN